MDARTQRTVLRVGTLLGALAFCTLVVVVVPNLDPRFMQAIYGLGITAALGLDQWIKNSGENAPPTVAGVSAAIENQAGVPEPKVAVSAAGLQATQT